MKKNAIFYKKITLGFLIWTILSTAILNGIVSFYATYYYATTGFPWYEWMNYFFLSVFLVFTPVVSLFFLDSVYVRRFLRFFLAVMLLNKFTKFSDLLLGPFQHLNVMLGYDRGLTSLYFFIEFIAQSFCLIFILGQIRGKSLLPIAVNTDRKGFKFIQNIKNFISGSSPHISPEDQKKITILIAVNVIIFVGLFSTLIMENKQITLQRPEDHTMDIKFWVGSSPLKNSTLEIFSNNHIEVYGWLDNDAIAMYSEFGIPSYKYKNIPFRPTDDRDTYFNELSSYLDWADQNKDGDTKSFKGFVSDFEDFSSIALVNETFYLNVLEYHAEIIQYVNDRGYEYSIVETMHSIGDLYDGDSDVDLVYMNPFHPEYYENASYINWMVYRMEKAMPYDEPFEYFTYQWASHINRYMKYLEETYDYPEGYWTSRSGMSIGVTASYFYTYNSEVRGYDISLNEFIQDVKICHASEIGEIAIFILSDFLDNWGEEGIITMLEELNTYEEVSFPYKRRATYFGNLRWGVNINGSVFGLFFSDGFYSSWFNILSLISIIALALILIASVFIKIPDTSFYGKKTHLNKKLEDNIIEESPLMAQISQKSQYLRISFFVLLILILFWVIVIAEIFFFPKEAIGWLEYYWKNVALTDPIFNEIWTESGSDILTYLIIAIVGIPLILFFTAKIIDYKQKNNNN